ncbi:DUF6461 domain-containing protein [Streptosporangium carneum]|uniref:Uncharacterized protein n=1 Tax=Streptosporangium carneum TaxID=47481 RepID=A0A9W6HX19_9ACTN|nr:DUF6461 domain-containing protein [Streptosporangium carneum]GLK07178.1 hypothetical protein GCM10017600_05830 [Streptosporangium carneum]
MNTGQPPTADLREHYQRLISNTQWLSAGMCWTAIVADNGRALTLDQVTARLAGNTPYQLHEPAPLDAIAPPERDAYPVLVDQCGSTTVLFEWGCLGTSPAVLRRLSEGARVYNAWWNVNANNLLSFAAAGEHVLAIDALFPGRPEHHAGLARWPELQAMTDFFAEPLPEDLDEDEDEDDLDGRADHDWKPACLAVIDHTTGARLTGEWLEQPHPYVTVHMPDATR